MNINKSTYYLLFIIFIILQILFLGCDDSFDVEENHFDDKIIGVWKRQGISDSYRWYFLKFTNDKISQRFYLGKYYDVWEWEYFFNDSNQYTKKIYPNSSHSFTYEILKLTTDSLTIINSDDTISFCKHDTLSDSLWNLPTKFANMDDYEQVMSEMYFYYESSWTEPNNRIRYSNIKEYMINNVSDTIAFIANIEIIGLKDYNFFYVASNHDWGFVTRIIDYGDGVSDTGGYPYFNHMYDSVGEFDVTYTVIDTNGIIYTETKEKYITVVDD